jgi:transcriptional regulator with PAS, ATPase and Fis domain
MGESIGIADNPEVLQGVELLEDFFGCRFEKYPIHSFRDVKPAVESLVNRGVDVLVGKWVYVEMVRERKVKTVVLTSGLESIIQAINEARKLFQVRRSEVTRNEQLRAILDFIADGVLAVDEKGMITVCNPMVGKILNLYPAKIIGQKIDDCLPHSRVMHVLETGTEDLNRIQEENGAKIIVNCIPIRHGNKVIGAVSTFQELKKWQQQEQEIRKQLARRGHVTKYRLEGVVGESRAFKQVMDKVKRYARADSTVLLSGETGVGKEVFAHLIHSLSARSKGPFVAVNCAAIPENLLESELFGYVEGAFTGARKGGKAGLFELAHGGTLFLDEIGEMAASLQARLLRVLQEGEVMRLGDERMIPVNVRVIAASNRDLEEMVREGEFRADLFYRINVLHIAIPPLRERREDIPLLCRHFLQELKANAPHEVCGFDPEAMAFMQKYHWPGNIRELRNLVERAMILAPGAWITAETVAEAGGKAFQDMQMGGRLNEPGPVNLHDYETRHIMRVMEQVGGNQSEAAKILGIGRTTLWRKLKQNRPE